jgi:hypothetical protein
VTTPGVRRFAQQQIDRALTAIPDDPVATVTAVQSGAGQGGIATVTVNYFGASLSAVPYLASYTPAVGHIVVLGRSGGQLYIRGRLVGFPA